ncbi:MAG: hypothetical protein IKX40_00930 [Thermoguttaceae bacterium]|nr:hypothetical protein [Thermoguttaceae bacterium]
MDSCELFIDSAHSGVWNMSFDEALLRRAEPICRFYRWDTPTVSLGYFQKPELNPLTCSTVRRTTGGGAIVHDNELTYSIVFPAHSEQYEWGPDLYGIVHQSLISVLRSIGVDAKMAHDDPPMREKDKPFLCFERRSRYDIVLADQNGKEYKIMGSAQRRTQEAVLQHGSILLNRSSVWTDLLGINDLVKLPEPLTTERLINLWAPALVFALDVRIIPVDYPFDFDDKIVAEIAKEKYGNPDWKRK